MTARSRINEPIPKYWMVSINEPDRGFYVTRTVGVVAMDLIAALQAVQEKYPNATIVEASHRGPVNIIKVLHEI